MFDLTSTGRWIFLAGAMVMLVGGALWLLGRAGLPIGNLPGDIRIQRDGFSCFFPIATSIFVSILLTVVLNVIVRLLNR